MNRDLLLATFELGPSFGVLESEGANSLAATFSDHLETTANLLQLPHFLILVGELKAEEMMLFTVAVSEGGAYRDFNKSAETQRAVYKRVSELTVARDKDKGALEHRDLHISGTLDNLLRQPQMQLALEGLVYAAVAFLWTAVESVCRDAWITALNTRGRGLGQRVLAELRGDDDPDISRRHVSVGLLAKYGFDLREHLGTVLSSKFDFSSVRGIKEAYEVAFGRHSQIVSAVDTRVVHELEAARHVIVHNAGRVDAAYVRRSGSSATLGSKIEIPAQQIKEFLSGVEAAGKAVLEHVDRWLTGNDAPQESAADERTDSA